MNVIFDVWGEEVLLMLIEVMFCCWWWVFLFGEKLDFLDGVFGCSDWKLILGGFFWCWKDFVGEVELFCVLVDDVCGVWGVVGVLKSLGEDCFWELYWFLFSLGFIGVNCMCMLFLNGLMG